MLGSPVSEKDHGQARPRLERSRSNSTRIMFLWAVSMEIGTIHFFLYYKKQIKYSFLYSSAWIHIKLVLLKHRKRWLSRFSGPWYILSTVFFSPLPFNLYGFWNRLHVRIQQNQQSIKLCCPTSTANTLKKEKVTDTFQTHSMYFLQPFFFYFLMYIYIEQTSCIQHHQQGIKWCSPTTSNTPWPSCMVSFVMPLNHFLHSHRLWKGYSNPSIKGKLNKGLEEFP